MSDLEQTRADRDSLAFLGLLARAYLTWDPPIAVGKDSSGRDEYTHFTGLNIQAAIVDNPDGALLALERNGIHEAESPVEHAEQRAVRAAVAVLRQKRTRRPGESVEAWYRSRLFYDKGTDRADFVTRGSTLYSTLEPCPMCATTLLVGRVKRVVYLIPDGKFGGSWRAIKDNFYRGYELAFEPLLPVAMGPLGARAALLHAELMGAIDEMRTAGIQDTWFLDRVHPLLSRALDALLVTRAEEVPDEVNQRLLTDLKLVCRLPG